MITPKRDNYFPLSLPTAKTHKNQNLPPIPQDVNDFKTRVLAVDVRSPVEYEQGHIPGAANLPLFTNEERAIVGKIFKQKGRFEAIKVGLSLVGQRFKYFVDFVCDHGGTPGSDNPILVVFKVARFSSILYILLLLAGPRNPNFSSNLSSSRCTASAAVCDPHLWHGSFPYVGSKLYCWIRATSLFEGHLLHQSND